MVQITDTNTWYGYLFFVMFIAVFLYLTFKGNQPETEIIWWGECGKRSATFNSKWYEKIFIGALWASLLESNSDEWKTKCAVHWYHLQKIILKIIDLKAPLSFITFIQQMFIRRAELKEIQFRTILLFYCFTLYDKTDYKRLKDLKFQTILFL